MALPRRYLEFAGAEPDKRCAKCKSHQFLVQDGPDSLGHTYLHTYLNMHLGDLKMTNIIHHWSGNMWWPCREYYKEIA